MPPRGWRLRTLLLAFAATLVIPALVATGLLLVRDARLQREQIDRRVEQVAADLATDIDGQLRLMTSTLQVMARMLETAGPDFRPIHEAATQSMQPLGLSLLLRDEDGQQLFNTRVPWGTALPVSHQPEIDSAIRSGLNPHYSNLLVGRVAGRAVVTVTVPVALPGGRRGQLHMSFDPERILEIMRNQKLPPEWNTGVSDRTGTIVARLQRHADFVGKKLPEELRSDSISHKGSFRTTNVEGLETVRAAVVSPLTGWLISANVPATVARQAMIANIWSVAGVAMVLGALAFGLSFALARVIARPIGSIAAAAVMVEGGTIPPRLDSPVREANDVAAALRRASKRLRYNTQELRSMLDRNTVLVRELAHRSKNLLAVVDAVARRTLRTAPPDQAADLLGARIAALARLQDLVISGTRGGIDLRELIDTQLAPFAAGESRVQIEGMPLRLRPQAANAIGMALHELATNATKYGALSQPQGSVDISWRIDPGADGTLLFRMSWRESGGPPISSPTSAPLRRGFGTSVVTDMTAATLKGRATLEPAPGGIVWQVDAPADSVCE